VGLDAMFATVVTVTDPVSLLAISGIGSFPAQGCRLNSVKPLPDI
jgi:hypothetical protein